MSTVHNQLPGATPQKPGRITLFTQPECPYSPIVKAMLDHKHFRYRQIDLITGLHGRILSTLGFPERTVPALKIAGSRVHSTIDAVHVIDRVRPERSLLPSDHDQRRAVEDLVNWARQTIGPIKSHILWWGMHTDIAFSVALWETARMGVPKPLIRMAVPKAIRALGRSEPPDRDAALECLATIPGVLEHIDTSIETGVIGGSELNAGDFHAAAVGRLLMSLGDLDPFVRERPVGELALRIYSDPPARSAPFLPTEQMQVFTGSMVLSESAWQVGPVRAARTPRL
jgi:glutathione S-transferase